MDVDINNFPPGLAAFIHQKLPRAKSISVRTYGQMAEVRRGDRNPYDGSASVIPTYLVYMPTGQWVQLMVDTPKRPLRSGEALLVLNRFPYVEILKSDLSHIATPRVEQLDNPLFRGALFIFTHINSRGNYRREAKDALEHRFGEGALQVAIDSLLEQGLITLAKNGAVTATAKGKQASSSLSDLYDNPASGYFGGKR